MATCTECIGGTHIVIVAQVVFYVKTRLCLVIYHWVNTVRVLTDQNNSPFG